MQGISIWYLPPGSWPQIVRCHPLFVTADLASKELGLPPCRGPVCPRRVARGGGVYLENIQSVHSLARASPKASMGSRAPPLPRVLLRPVLYLIVFFAI